ncbi:MAG: DNA translocase FtsK [Anaerolineae bacterium]|nr:DNA translocase FtsK [Anaerolineae bacterium]
MNGNAILTQRANQLRGVARTIQEMAAANGICRQTTFGALPFGYKSLVLDGSLGMLDVDTGAGSIPHHIPIKKLEDLAHEVGTRTGYDVRTENHYGLKFLVDLEVSVSPAFPNVAQLDYLRRLPRGFAIPLGVDGHGNHVWYSLHDTESILIGGQTRSGKSTMINSFLAGLLPQHTPRELNIALIDPKGTEFLLWDGVPHQIAPIAEEPEDAVAIAEALVREMQTRRVSFKAARVRNLEAFNARQSQAGQPPLPLILLVIDEVADLVSQDDTITKPLTRLASKGAALGIILVIATQHPKAKVVDTLIRSNLNTRIAFRVMDADHSRTILGFNVDGHGAHRLPRARGRFLLRYDADLVELQGFYVSDEEIDRIIAGLDGLESAESLKVATPEPENAEDDDLTAMNDWEPTPPQPTGPLPELTEQEWDILGLSVRKMAGDLAVGRLHKLMQGRVPKSTLNDLCQRLGQAGWATTPEYQGQPRRCTDELIVQVQHHLDS